MPRRRFARALAPWVAVLALAAGCASADEALVTANSRRQSPTTEAPPATDDAPATTADRASTTEAGDAADDSDASATTEATPTTVGTASQTLTWEPCQGDDELECASLDVPLDYDDPAAGTITLQLQRSLATDPDERVGSLLINPGGPGVSTLSEGYVQVLPLIFDEEIVERFDIVGWDPRGVGLSEHVDCVDDLDPYLGALDPTPDTEAEQSAFGNASAEFVAQCEANSGDLLPHVSTQDSARDMDAIRAALGEETISYFGFSYGSMLGATFATMFPDRVRSMVIDAARNPSADVATFVREQAVGIERALDAILADCADDEDCAFHNGGDPYTAFDELVAELDVDPLPAPEGRPPIGQGILMTATLSALYDQMMWESLTDALAEAQAGDGTGLLDLYDQYWRRLPDGSWSNTYEALVAINCIDQSGAQPVEDREALAAELIQLAPRTGAWAVPDDTCTRWPATVPQVEITGAGAGPILVLGNTGDPVTPIESTEAMARALEEGRLLSYAGTGHITYIEAVLNDDRCVLDTVTEYLVDRTVPPEDIVCD